MLASPVTEEMTTTTRRRPLPARALPGSGLLVGLGLLAAAIGLFVGLERASVESFGGNSDGATVVLEGLALSHGHLALSGWDLSFDSFWSVDALVYGAAVGLLGLRSELLHVVPAVLALTVVAVGAATARGRMQGLPGLVAAIAVVATLGLPTPILSFFTLQGSWHVGTALWCLLAFLCVARGRFGLAWTAGVCLLAAGMLGDLQALILGSVPCLFGGAAAALRSRSLRRGLPVAAAAPASAALALVARFVAVRTGTFAIARGVTRAHPAQFPMNLEHVFTWGAALLGVGGLPIGPSAALSAHEAAGGAPASEVLHGTAVALVLLGVGGAVVSLVRGVVTGGQRDGRGLVEATLDDLLFFGVGGSVVLFIALCPNGNADYARYLTAAVIFGVILGGRRLGQVLRASSAELARGVAIAAAVLTIAAAVEFQSAVRRPPAPQPAFALASFLAAHHLTEGVGDYWSSSLVTVVSDGRVVVRPVIRAPGGRLARYGRQSSADWYAGRRFQFLVFDLARPWRRVDATTAAAAFGAPTTTYAVGTYRILVYAGGITVSPVGFTNA